jgi:UPF0755 protein
MESRQAMKPLALLLLAVALLLTACASDAALALYLETNRDRLDQPASDQPRPTEFQILPGAPARQIAADLEAAGLVADALLFEAYVRVNGLAGKLEAGTFNLSPDMTTPQIAAALQNALAPGTVVAVRPGWRLEQTAALLDQLGVVAGAEYQRLAQQADLSAIPIEDRRRWSFLQFHPAGQGLEGYLYPDTYELPQENASAADLLKAQLDAFEQRVMPVYWQAVAGGATMDLHDVLTLASIVEREAVLDEERPVIAGVYLNRLRQGMRLEADPTVQYAMGYQPASGQWWKTPVFIDEYDEVDSPYNTYRNAGLPPGPIAAPRLASVEAVLAPAEHDYLYFVAEPGGTGRHVFSRTFEEHLQAVERFRRG